MFRVLRSENDRKLFDQGKRIGKKLVNNYKWNSSVIIGFFQTEDKDDNLASEEVIKRWKAGKKLVVKTLDIVVIIKPYAILGFFTKT